MHPLFGGLRHRRRSEERRVGWTGARLRQPDQPRCPLRQGRLGTRARSRRTPPAHPDEAAQRQVGTPQLGCRAEGSQRTAAGHPREGRPRRHLLGRLLEALQRAGLPAAQVRELLGHQQLRPPGAHLSLHHRGGRGEHLGLRGDDQLLQRHAERQGDLLHRVERRRGAPGVDAAHPACQGGRRQDHRGRPALHPHRGQGRPLRAPALGLRHRADLRCDAPHFRKRLGRQEVHRRPRVRHGQDPRGIHAMDRRQGARRHRGA